MLYYAARFETLPAIPPFEAGEAWVIRRFGTRDEIVAFLATMPASDAALWQVGCSDKPHLPVKPPPGVEEFYTGV